MELIIAVLISFGFLSDADAGKANSDDLKKIMIENSISQEDISKEAKIIGLEESDL